MRTLILTIVILFTIVLYGQDPFVAISDNPGSMAAWDQLADLMASNGTPLRVFKYAVPFSSFRDSGGRTLLKIPPLILCPDETKPQSIIDSKAWMEYIQSKMPQDINGQSDFQLEIKSITRLLQMTDRQVSLKKILPTDPFLIQFSIFRRDKQLEPAIFLLHFQESFRHDFETWKRDNPNAIPDFIQKYHLRPIATSPNVSITPEETTAVGNMHGTIIRAIQVHHDNAHPDCKYSKEVFTQTLAKKYRNHDYTVPVTIEAWTIEACSSRQFIYKVEIYSGDEHSYIKISNINDTVIDPKP